MSGSRVLRHRDITETDHAVLLMTIGTASEAGSVATHAVKSMLGILVNHDIDPIVENEAGRGTV